MPESRPAVVFEVIDGNPVPRLPRGRTGIIVPDGVRYLSAAQCAMHFGQSEDYWRGRWESAWSAYMPPPADQPLDDGATEGPVVSAAIMAEEDCVRAVRFPHLNDGQWAYVINDCRRRKINPRLIWVRKRHNPETGEEEVVIITTIAAFRAVAERTGRRGKEHTPEFCGPDLVWKPGWCEADPPYAARVKIDRLDGKPADEGVAYWSMCAQFETLEGGRKQLTETWREGGPFMLGKCAAANGYRVGYGDVLDGLYTFDEMRVRSKTPAQQSGQVSEAASDVFSAGTGEVVDARPVEKPTLRDDPKFAWPLVDDTTPESSDSLMRSLLEIGASSVQHAKALVEMFRAQLPRLAMNHFKGFCAVVLWAVREHPAAYGVQAT